MSSVFTKIIEGTIPKSKIMTFNELSPRMRERFKNEISKMDDDDIISGEKFKALGWSVLSSQWRRNSSYSDF